MTVGIVEFLTARLDEDEAVAYAVGDDGDSFNAFRQPAAAYLRRWAPERMMAEVAAKRTLIEAAQPFGSLESDVLVALAFLYSDHPDYRHEWSIWP